jgi:nickel-dependent lactate racemase
MRVRLEYGRAGLEVELPDANVVGVLKLKPAPAIPNPPAAVAEALANPIGAKSLVELARGRRDACIVVCDVTRPVPNTILLPPILDALESGGLTRDRVTILIATGTHRPNHGAELDSMLGREIASTCRIVNHVCTDSDSQKCLGVSPNGVPVALNRTYCDADLKLSVGLIEPHFMAGFSGGRKLIMPGIAALETVQAWHSPRFLEHPNATSGVVDGNPVHEESLAIAKMARPDMIMDVTLDEQNRITGVFAGDLEAAWLAGVAFAQEHVRASVPEPVDIVVTTCAGAPLDATFYQAVKGMVGALPIVKPGGSIVIASECAEGVGSEPFRRQLVENDDLETYIEAMQRDDWTFVPDQWEVEELAKAVRDTTVYCVAAGIAAETLAQCFVTPANTVEQGVAAAMERHGPDARIAVIPKGPYVIPTVQATF